MTNHRRLLPLLFCSILGCSDDERRVPASGASEAEAEATSAPSPQAPPGRLVVDSPAHGSRVDGRLLELTGSSENLLELQVGSQTIPLGTDGSWSTRLPLDPGLQRVQLRAQPLQGRSLVEERLVLMGEGRDPESPVAEGLVLAISQNGLTGIADGLSSQLEPEMLQREIKKKGTLYSGTIGISGLAEARVTAELDTLDFESVESQVTPAKDQVDLVIRVHDLKVVTQLRIHALGGISQATMTMKAEQARVSCSLRPRIRDGKLEIKVRDAEVKFTGFKPRLSGIPAGMEPELIRREIRDALVHELKQALEKDLPAQVNPVLAQLTSNPQIVLGPETLHLQTQPVRVKTDPDGLELALSQDLSRSYPPTAQSVLALSHIPPRLDPEIGASVSIADDLPNLLLYEAWSQGSFSLDLSTEDGTLDPAVLDVLNAESASIQTTLSLPPVLLGTDSGVQLHAGPIQVRVLSPGGSLGSTLELELAIWIDLELYAQDQSLRLRRTDTESLLELVEHDWGIPGALIEGTVHGLLDLEDRIDQSLEELRIPIPAVPGLDLEPPIFDRSPDGGYTRGKINFR